MVHHQSVAEVVDVLRGAREMQILFEIAEFFSILVKFLLKIVFNGLDIMICGLLDLFNTFTIFFFKLLEYPIKKCLLTFDEVYLLGILRNNLLFKENLIPLKLDIHSVSHKGPFTVIWSKLIDLFGVSPIKWRNRFERRKLSADRS